MPEPRSSLSTRSRFRIFALCIALGCYPLAIALGILPVDAGKVMVPMWIVALSGTVFLIAGCMVLLGNHSWANDLLAGILCLLFGVMGAWTSLLASDTAYSGGLWFLSHATNVVLGRWVFGLGALICFAIAGYAFRRAYQSSR
jgi:hypothetical protein